MPVSQQKSIKRCHCCPFIAVVKRMVCYQGMKKCRTLVKDSWISIAAKNSLKGPRDRRLKEIKISASFG